MAYYVNRRNPNARVRKATLPPRTPFAGSPFFQRPQLGDSLGVLPLVAAAVPSVSTLLKNAANSLIGIVDPGKKRDANREARARMYGALAVQGSITAANRVYSAAVGIHGGEGPTKEAGWYKEEWAKIQAAVPTLAAAVPILPRVGLPDPQEPTLSAADQTLIQNEINAYHGIAKTATAAGTVLQSNAGLLLGLGILGAFLFRRR